VTDLLDSLRAALEGRYAVERLIGRGGPLTSAAQNLSLQQNRHNSIGHQFIRCLLKLQCATANPSRGL